MAIASPASISARVGISPVAHHALIEDPRSIPKQQSMDRSSQPKEIRVRPQVQDGLESAGSPATQAAPPSGDQRSWQMDLESTLVGDTALVFARNRVLPMTFHVLPGSSQPSTETMIVVSPTIIPGPRADQIASRRRRNHTSKPSFHSRRSNCLR